MCGKLKTNNIMEWSHVSVKRNADSSVFWFATGYLTKAFLGFIFAFILPFFIFTPVSAARSSLQMQICSQLPYPNKGWMNESNICHAVYKRDGHEFYVAVVKCMVLVSSHCKNFGWPFSELTHRGLWGLQAERLGNHIRRMPLGVEVHSCFCGQASGCKHVQCFLKQCSNWGPLNILPEIVLYHF